MDIVIHTDQMILRCKEVHKCTFFRRVEKVSNGTEGMWWWKKDSFKEVIHYDLRLEYKDMNGKNAVYAATCEDDTALKAQFKNIQAQVKAQDDTLIDRAFEEQVLKS